MLDELLRWTNATKVPRDEERVEVMALELASHGANLVLVARTMDIQGALVDVDGGMIRAI